MLEKTTYDALCLDDDKFREWRLKQNIIFFDNFIKLHDRYPRCNECNLIIDKSELLVRYHGTSLHNNCFLEFYGYNDINLDDGGRAYFDRVLSVILDANQLNLF